MKKRKVESFIKKNTWLPMLQSGWGNGYAVLPPGHKYFKVDYDDIPVEVHGGLTFGALASEIDWPEIKKEWHDCWIIGFDTAHYQDNKLNCDESYVRKETQELVDQLSVIY